ncbi:proclotting enzyme-like [Thrips palmi]|uniref:Proclotting enzyme-like n=1 Tax=Thrips palmi TaxID=161013 RepID=A0A6P8YI70_THRPL|nr:proclotting enzyme-like [Thrips palmi]
MGLPGCCLVLFLATIAVAHNGPGHLIPPSSPCPLVFRYEPSPTAATGWIGVVRLLAPPKFSALHLSVHLAARQHLPGEPGTLSLRGGVAAARAVIRATQQGRRAPLEFVAEFPCATVMVPALLNVTANGRVFCSAAAEPADTKSTISLEADLETGFDRAAPGDEDFGIAPEGSKVWSGQSEPARVCMPAAPPHDSSPSEAPENTAPGPSPSVINLPAVSRVPPGLPLFRPPPPPPSTSMPPPEPPAPPPHHSAEGFVQPSPTDACGRAWGANPLVTRGAAAARGRWPWLVALFKKLGRRDQLGLNFECGATLVSKKHVITAAHCVESRRGRPVDAAVLVVYLGKHDLLSYTEPGQQTAEVASVRMHPQYGRDTAYANDIALLVLADPVEPTRHIRPVCLWESAGADTDSLVGKIGAVPGWGKDDSGAISNEIRVANMPVVSQETCLRSNVFYLSFTSNTTFCAGFRNGTSVCNGDSGGGLFVKEPDGRWRIRGIVSVSMFSVNEQSCDSYNYAVFTDVSKFLPWLYDEMHPTL